MSEGFSNPIVGGGGALVYPSIHSPDYSAVAATGWTINKDGTVQFANLRIVAGVAPLIVLLAVVGGHDVGELSYINNGTPAFYLHAFSGFSELMADPIAAVEPGSASAPVPETPHVIPAGSYGSGWAPGGTDPLTYQMMPDGWVQLAGSYNQTSASPAATMFVLPTGWEPSAERVVPAINDLSGTLSGSYVFIMTNGDIQPNPVPGNGGAGVISARFRI